tara:strand:+ start:1005 stop:1517 length:513 start_codon:yes stop_codon:yes gene_type:complete
MEIHTEATVELSEPPKTRIKKIKVKTPSGDITTRRAINLDDVVREILIKFRAEWDLSTRELAARLGLSPQTIHGFLDESRPGGRIRIITHLCAALQETPATLFSRSESFASLDTNFTHQFRGLLNSSPLSEEASSQLVEVLTLAKKYGLFEVLVAQAHGFVTAFAENLEG